jgi:hypothetical protein
VKGSAAFGDHSNGNMIAQHDASSASSDAVLGSDSQQSEAALDLLGSLSTQGDYSPFCLLIKKSPLIPLRFLLSEFCCRKCFF